MRILEIGCGHGQNARRLARRADYTGVDIDRAAVAAAGKQFPRELSTNIAFAQMDAAALTFPDATFDTVYALDVLEHVDDPRIVISEAARVTKPGGRIVVEVPDARSERVLTRLRPTYPSDIGHVRVFSVGEISSLLTLSGLDVRSVAPLKGIYHLKFAYYFRREARVVNAEGQLSHANRFVNVIVEYFTPTIFAHPKLRLIPIWIILIPVGLILNRICPKSWRIVAEKVSTEIDTRQQ